jgi:YbbR domain-containing protein
MTERAGRWGLRALAVAGALTVWFFSSVEKRERISEKVVDASVTYNLPRGTILLDPIQAVKVRLRGPDRQLRTLSPWAIDVVIDVSESTGGGLDVVHLTAADVERPDGIDAVSIEPNSIPVRLDTEATRTLPVVPRIVGEPAGGSVPGDIVTMPESAIVRGPQSLLANLDSLTTSPVSLDGHAFSFDQTVSVIPPDPLIRVVQPTTVLVRVPMVVPDSEAPEGVRERRSGR